ncbi:hypothetical protein AB0A95_04940 [Micromonospora sp. NPDC049230]|uniref:hypothetical protein n=1 Tax=Micromonospora sp. NPDC049230 TaxID=3155502 RepID=UPI0033D850F8
MEATTCHNRTHIDLTSLPDSATAAPTSSGLRRQRTSVLDHVGVPAERTRVTMESRKVHATTSHTPDYLGLTGKSGVWKMLATRPRRSRPAGAGAAST